MVIEIKFSEAKKISEYRNIEITKEVDFWLLYVIFELKYYNISKKEIKTWKVRLQNGILVSQTEFSNFYYRKHIE